MTSSGYTARYEALLAQRAYTRAIAARGVSALMAPYTQRPVSVPLQRRRVVRERISA